MSKKLTRFVFATLLGLLSTLIPQSALAEPSGMIPAPSGYDAEPVFSYNPGSQSNIYLYVDQGGVIKSYTTSLECDPGEYVIKMRFKKEDDGAQLSDLTVNGNKVNYTLVENNYQWFLTSEPYTVTGTSQDIKISGAATNKVYTLLEIAVYQKTAPKISYTSATPSYNEDAGATLTISGIQNANGQNISYSVVNTATNEVVRGPFNDTIKEGATSWTSEAIKGLANGTYKFQFTIADLAASQTNPGYSKTFKVSAQEVKILSVDIPSVMTTGQEYSIPITLENLTEETLAINGVSLYCQELGMTLGSIYVQSLKPGVNTTYEYYGERPMIMNVPLYVTNWITGGTDPLPTGTYTLELRVQGTKYDWDTSSYEIIASKPFTVEVEEAMPETVKLQLVNDKTNIPETYTISKNALPYKVDYAFENKGKTAEGTIKLFVGTEEKASVTENLAWKKTVSGYFEINGNDLFKVPGTYTVQVIAEADGSRAETSKTVTVDAEYSLDVSARIPRTAIATQPYSIPVTVKNDGVIPAHYRIMVKDSDKTFDKSNLPFGTQSQLLGKTNDYINGGYKYREIYTLEPGESADLTLDATSNAAGELYVAVVYGCYEDDGDGNWTINKTCAMAPAEAQRVIFSEPKPNVAVSYAIADNKTAYVEGETISVTATLENFGNSKGNTGEVILYGEQDGGTPVALAKVQPKEGIAPGASTTVELTTDPLTAAQVGEWELFVQYQTDLYVNSAKQEFTFTSLARQTVTVRAHEYGVEMTEADGAEEIVAGTPLIVEVTLKNHLDAFTDFRLTAVSEIDAIESVEDATVSLGVDEEKTYTLKINFKEDADPIQLFSYVLFNGATPVMEAKGGVNIVTPEAPDYAIDEESFAINYPEELEEGTANFDVTVSFKNIGREIEGFNLKVVGSDVAESTVEAVELATDAEGEYTITVKLAEELGDAARFEGSLVLINEENVTLFEYPIYVNITPAPEEGYEVTIDEERTVIVPAGVEKLQAGIQYVAKTVLNNLGQALKVRVDVFAMGGVSILDGEGTQAGQVVGSTEVDLEAGDRDVTVEIPYILQSEGEYTLSLVVTADDPEIDLNPVMIEEPVDVEVVEPEMPSLEEWGLDEDTATEIKTGETWQANVYIKAENAVENWVLVAKGGNVATSNEAVVNIPAGETGNYVLNITFDGTTENELGEDVFAYEMYLVNGLIEIPFLQGTVGLIPTYEYDVTIAAPEAIEANKVFNVTVNFDNKADRIRDWKANLYVGEDLIGSAAINAAAKTAVEVTVEGEVYTAGEKNFRVDVINNENEVVKTETFTVDVTMTSVAIATEVPAKAAAGKEFEVNATITNDGTEAFEAYTVELLVNDEVVETKESTEALAAEEAAEFTFALTEEPETYNVAVRFTSGEYTLTSEVKKVVVEEVITVAFAAQFAESYEVGDTVATTLTVTNDSRVAVAGKLYTYAKSAETTENSPVAEAVEINLEAGESTEVPVEIKDLAEGTWDVYFILREGDYFSDVIAESGKYTINMVVTPTEVKVGDLVVKAESEVIAGEAWEATVEFANEGIALEGYKLAAYCDGVELASTEVAVAFRETFKHTFEINFSEEAFGPQQVTFYLFNAEKEEVASQIVDVTIVDPAPEFAGTVVAAQPAEAYVYRTIEVPVTVTNNGDVTFDSYNVYLVVDNEALILTGVAGVEPLAAGESAVVYPFFRTDEEGIYNVKAVLIANGETIDTSDEIAIDVVNAPVVREPNVTATAEFDNEIYVGETLNVTVTLKNESLPVDFKLTAVGAEVAEATEIEGSLAEGAEETYELAVKFTDEAYASVPFSVVVTVGNKVFETPLNVTIVDKPEEPRPSVEVPGLEIPVGYHGYAYWTPAEIANFQGAAGMNLNTEYLPTSFTVEGIAMGKALTSPTVSLQEGRSYLLAYFVDNRAAQNSSVKLTAWEGIEGLQIRNNAKDWTIVTVNYTAEEDKDVDVTLGFNLFSGAKATVYGLAVLESDDFVSPVIESEVNTNVADATVRFESEAGWNYTVVTDAEGNATLDVNNNTVYNVVAMKSAYKDSESIVWTAGPVETETLSFELEENAVNELSLFVNDDNAPYNVVLSWDAVTPGSLDPTVEYRVYLTVGNEEPVHVATVNQPAAAAEMRAAGVVSYDFVGLSKGSYTFGVAAYFPASQTETTVAEINYDLVSTGIGMIVNDSNVEAIYDLNGRRISKENVEAGMYVIRYANGETRRVMVTK